MARQRKAQADLNHQAEVLAASVDPVDTGSEDPLLRQVLSPEFVTMPNTEAAGIALLLQELVRGQTSLLQQQAGQAEAVSKLMQRMDQYDQAEAAWRKNQDQFSGEVIRRKGTKGKTDQQVARLRAQGIKQYQTEIAQAKVENASNRVKFEQDLAKMPQVDLIVAGKIETYQRGQQNTPMLMPEEIRIRHKVWILKPGISYKVPKIVADRYQQMLRDRQENAERQTLLDGHNQDTVVAAGMANISAKYGTKTDAFPIASR